MLGQLTLLEVCGASKSVGTAAALQEKHQLRHHVCLPSSVMAALYSGYCGMGTSTPSCEFRKSAFMHRRTDTLAPSDRKMCCKQVEGMEYAGQSANGIHGEEQSAIGQRCNMGHCNEKAVNVSAESPNFSQWVTQPAVSPQPQCVFLQCQLHQCSARCELFVPHSMMMTRVASRKRPGSSESVSGSCGLCGSDTTPAQHLLALNTVHIPFLVNGL